MPIVREPGAPAPYQQIREILRQEILENMSPGDRVAAERDLAKRFDANRATVSRAVNSLVKDGLLVRRVGRGTYIANGDEGARRIRTSTIGLVIPFIQGDFPAGIIRSAVKGLRERGYRTVLFDSEGSPTVEVSELDRLMQEGLDGALVMPVDKLENDAVFARMIRFGYPMVFLDRRSPNVQADCVATDNFWGAYQAVSHLIERGHTRIAHFTWLMGWDSTAIRDRRRGYEQALADHGIEPDPELVCPPTPFHEEELAFKHAISYLRQGPRPITAAFILNDTFCLAVISSCRALGLRIPEDVEIASFFDGAVRPHPPFLRVVQDQAEIGKRGVELLVSRVEGNGPEGPQTIEVRPQILDDLA